MLGGNENSAILQQVDHGSFDSMNPAQILACHLFVSGILCIDIFEGLLEI